MEPQPLAQPDTQPDLRGSAKSFCGAPARWRAAALGSPGHLSHGEAGPAALRRSCSSHYDSSPAGPGHVSVQSRRSQGSPDTPWEPLLQIQLFCSISLAFPLLPSWRIHQTVPLLLNFLPFSGARVLWKWVSYLGHIPQRSVGFGSSPTLPRAVAAILLSYNRLPKRGGSQTPALDCILMTQPFHPQVWRQLKSIGSSKSIFGLGDTPEGTAKGRQQCLTRPRA